MKILKHIVDIPYLCGEEVSGILQPHHSYTSLVISYNDNDDYKNDEWQQYNYEWCWRLMIMAMTVIMMMMTNTSIISLSPVQGGASVTCWKSTTITINELLPHSCPCLYGETPAWLQLSKVGCHQKVPRGLRRHTQSFWEVKFIVIAWLKLYQNDDAVERYIIWAVRLSRIGPS